MARSAPAPYRGKTSPTTLFSFLLHDPARLSVKCDMHVFVHGLLSGAEKWHSSSAAFEHTAITTHLIPAGGCNLCATFCSSRWHALQFQDAMRLSALRP
jgi:hypothetical protein